MNASQIGLSGVLVNQSLLDIAGQNVANANTPGFHRRQAVLAETSNGTTVGTGVEVTQIRRSINTSLETSLNRVMGTTGQLSTQVDSLNQVQTLLAPGEGSVHDLLQKFFNQAQELSAQPDDLTQRRLVLATAQTLVNQVNSTTTELHNLSADLGQQGASLVQEVNSLAKHIAELNVQIQNAVNQGGDDNGLRDQRDTLIQQMSQIVDVRTIELKGGVVNVFGGGQSLVLYDQAATLKWQTSGADQSATVSVVGSNNVTNITSGKLGGLLQVLGKSLPTIRDQFTTFQRQLATSLDEIHAQGVGLSGPMTLLDSQRLVNPPNAKLIDANLAFPPKPGTLTVGITDLATGNRTLKTIVVNPITQTLQDVASTLNTVPHLQAVVDAASGGLRLLSDQGFGFDFAGGVGSVPSAQANAGTSSLQLAGHYTGTTNDTWNVSVVGSGTVGVATPLSLEVRNQANQLIGSFNIGQGYEPGTTLQTLQGVSLTMPAGTVQNGDSFTVPVVADSDSSQILSALGLNTFFTGNPDGTLAVRADLLGNPDRFALGTSALPADTTNLLRLLDAQDQLSMQGGTQTFQQFLENMVGTIGVQTQDSQLRLDAQTSLQQQLSDQQQSVSGIDPNEELVRIMQYQRAFQMSAKYLSVINDTLDSLVQIVR